MTHPRAQLGSWVLPWTQERDQVPPSQNHVSLSYLLELGSTVSLPMAMIVRRVACQYNAERRHTTHCTPGCVRASMIVFSATRGSVSAFTWVRRACRSATRAGNSTAWSMAFRYVRVRVWAVCACTSRSFSCATGHPEIRGQNMFCERNCASLNAKMVCSKGAQMCIARGAT